MKKKKSSRHTIIYILLVLAALIFCAVLWIQILSVRRKNSELEARQTRLEELLSEQQERAAELDNEEVYVQTRKYIEEKAKSIGYVYPDEIIFKKDE